MPNVSLAYAVSYDDTLSWLSANVLLDPPAAGSSISSENLDKVRPWIPPGLMGELDFPEFVMEIQKYEEKKPQESYLDATEKFSGESLVGNDGSLLNYTAGKPFSEEQIQNSDPRTAGYMIAWNNIHRWQHYGVRIQEMFFSLSSGASPSSEPT
jgi:hypothetical protein